MYSTNSAASRRRISKSSTSSSFRGGAWCLDSLAWCPACRLSLLDHRTYHHRVGKRVEAFGGALLVQDGLATCAALLVQDGLATCAALLEHDGLATCAALLQFGASALEKRFCVFVCVAHSLIGDHFEITINHPTASAQPCRLAVLRCRPGLTSCSRLTGCGGTSSSGDSNGCPSTRGSSWLGVTTSRRMCSSRGGAALSWLTLLWRSR